MDIETTQITQENFGFADDKKKHKENVFLKMDWDLHFSKEFSDHIAQHPMSEKVPKVNAVFRWNDKGDQVFLSGSYDNWSSKLPLTKSGPEFFTIKELPPGKHEYRFLVDGEWKVNINEPVVSSLEGHQLNVLTITKSDLDVFDALAVDDSRTPGISFASPGSEWTQEVPPRGSGYAFMRSGPPIIPPQLSNTILNHEIPQQCDPTILTQPSHVVLNHLYSLSIKDGVLVLGTTYRYRKKYITAVIYKPI